MRTTIVGDYHLGGSHDPGWPGATVIGTVTFAIFDAPISVAASTVVIQDGENRGARGGGIPSVLYPAAGAWWEDRYVASGKDGRSSRCDGPLPARRCRQVDMRG